MIEYSFNIKSLDYYDEDVVFDMADSMIDGKNGDEFYVMEQIMDTDDEGYITFEGRWSWEPGDDGKKLNEYDIANALGFWRQDHGVDLEGTFTITKNGVSTVYDPEGNVKK